MEHTSQTQGSGQDYDSTFDRVSPSAIVRRMREIIQASGSGWCQRASARDAKRNPVSPLNPSAVKFSLGGAMLRAFVDLGGDPQILASSSPGVVVDWNDLHPDARAFFTVQDWLYYHTALGQEKNVFNSPSSLWPVDRWNDKFLRYPWHVIELLYLAEEELSWLEAARLDRFQGIMRLDRL